MSDRPTAPLLDEDTLRHALEHLRQAEPLGDTPLRRLVWVRQHLEARGPAASPVELDVALGEALAGLIEENLANLRRITGANGICPPTSEASPSAALQADFGCGNTELEAWSALYHRYVRLDLNWQVQEMAHLLGTSTRQITRRLDHGYRRLTEAISRLETQARAANWRLWLRLKLPPPAYATLFGLQEPLTRLREKVLAPPPPHGIVLAGPGGIGKTTLSHALVRQLVEEDHFADLAWLSLEAPTAYPTLLAMLARSLGYLHLAGTEAAELEAGLRVRLASVPTLVVIDNADRLDNYSNMIAHLDALVGPGRVLLASRQRPAPDASVHLFPVEPLSRDDLTLLLRETARLRRISQGEHLDEAAIDTIYAATGGNPLAGRLVVSQLAFLPLARVLENLASLPTAQGEGLFDTLFGEAWQSIGQAAQQAGLAFCLLPTGGAEWADLLAAADLPAADLDGALRELISRSLVEAGGDGPRYGMHPLARRFVEERSRQAPWQDRYHRLLRAAIERQRQSGLPPLLDSGSLEQSLILLHRQAEAGDQPETLAELVAQVAPAARRSGQWLAWRDTLLGVTDRLRSGATCAAGRARVWLELGVAARWLGDLEAARASLEEAVRLSGEQGDFVEQAEALLEVGQLAESLGQTEPAYLAYQRAAAAAQRYDAPDLRRRALNGLAGLALNNHHTAEALGLLQQALATFGDDPPDGQTLSALGMAYLQAGDVQQAIETERQAIAAFQEAGDLPRLARAYLRLGMACQSGGQSEKALDHLREGLALTRALGDALGQARLLNNLGAVYAGQQRQPEALATWRDALALQQQLGDRVGMAHTWYNLADLQWALGQHEAARASLIEARVLAESLLIEPLLAHIAEHPAAGE